MYFNALKTKLKKKQKNFNYEREKNTPFEMNMDSNEFYFKNQDFLDDKQQYLEPRERYVDSTRGNGKAKKREEKLRLSLQRGEFVAQKRNGSKIKTVQILKAVSTLLLVVAANNALAWDLDAGTKASLQPFYKWVVDWWAYIVGLTGCGMAMLGEGDLRVRSKNAGVGATCAAVVMLILIGAMGNALQGTTTQ